MAIGVETGRFLLPSTSVIAQVMAHPVRHVRQAAGRYRQCYIYEKNQNTGFVQLLPCKSNLIKAGFLRIADVPPNRHGYGVRHAC